MGIWAPPLLCCFQPQQSRPIARSLIVCYCLLVPPFPCCAGELWAENEEGALWRVRGLDTLSRRRNLGLISGNNKLNSLWFSVYGFLLACMLLVPGAWGSQKRTSDPLVLELQEVVVFQVGAENQTRVLEEQQVLLTAQSSLQLLDRGC